MVASLPVNSPPVRAGTRARPLRARFLPPRARLVGGRDRVLSPTRRGRPQASHRRFRLAPIRVELEASKAYPSAPRATALGRKRVYPAPCSGPTAASWPASSLPARVGPRALLLRRRLRPAPV